MKSDYEIKILLVDDNHPNLIALGAALSHPEYQIFKCSSGQEAIELIRRHEFAVALIDVQMPMLDGFETTKMIHQAQGALRTPIIFVTANIPDPLLIRKGYEAGAVDFLFKPLDLDILQFKISTFVDLYRSKKQANELEALRRERAENRFRYIAEGMPTLVFTADPEGQVTYFNQRWYEYTGNPREEDQLANWQDSIHPDDLTETVREWMKSVNTGKPLEREHRVRRGSDQMYRWHLVRAIPVKDDNGRIAEWLGTLSDIHDQKMAAEQLDDLVKKRTSDLARSEEFLESLIENIPNMVFVKDAEKLGYVRFNRAGEELIGYSRADLIGKNDYDFFPKDQADFFTSKDRAVLAGRVIVDIPEENIQTRYLGERILHTRKIPVFGPNGKPRYLLGISEDITEQKRAEENKLKLIREQAMNEERENATRRLEFLADASTILSSSLDYRQTLNSLAKVSVPTLGDWCTVTMLKEDGYTFERVSMAHARPEGMKWLEELSRYFPPNMDESKGVGHVIRSGKAVFAATVSDEAIQGAAQDEHHLNIMRKLGCHSCIVAPIRARDKVLGAISFVFDSHHRCYTPDDLALAEELGRRAGIAVENALLYEATQKAVLTRDNFLSVASHELKTPITSLKLHLQMTRRATKPEDGTTPSAEKLARVLDTATGQVDRLTALVDDLLDVSRIGADKLSYDFEPLNLSEFVGEVVERYSEHMRRMNSPVRFHAKGVVHAVCDRFRMEQVILNLLSNAGKYGAGKPVDVTVSQVGKRALIVVEDRGMGVPKEKLGKIFERFERAVSSNNISGLGLGLYISYEIVKAHKGIIEVESELGKGSIFTVDFPCNLPVTRSVSPPERSI